MRLFSHFRDIYKSFNILFYLPFFFFRVHICLCLICYLLVFETVSLAVFQIVPHDITDLVHYIGARHFVVVFEFSAVHFIHQLVDN